MTAVFQMGLLYTGEARACILFRSTVLNSLHTLRCRQH